MAFSSSSARRQTTTGDADPPGPRPPPSHIRASYVLAMTDTRKCVCIELGLLWAGFTLFFRPMWLLCVLQPRKISTVKIEEENDKCEPHF